MYVKKTETKYYKSQKRTGTSNGQVYMKEHATRSETILKKNTENGQFNDIARVCPILVVEKYLRGGENQFGTRKRFLVEWVTTDLLRKVNYKHLKMQGSIYMA